jgi:hypothetical protein
VDGGKIRGLGNQYPSYEKNRDDFKLGMANSTLRTALGGYDWVNQAVGGEGLSDVQRDAMANMQQDVSESGGYGTAGGIVGDIAQLALPASAIAKGAKFLPQAAKAKGVLAADIGLGTAFGANKLPGEEESRAQNAAIDGTGALFGGMLGPVLRKAVTGINTTAAGKRMLDTGAYMTPASVSESTVPRAAEYTMQITPFLARGVQKAKDKMNKSWNMIAVNRANPLSKDIVDDGVEGVRELKNNFDTAYSSAWGKATKPSNQDLVRIINQGEVAAEQLAGPSAYRINKAIDGLSKISDGEFTTKGLKSVDNVMRKEIAAASKTGDPAVDVLRNMRAELRTSAGDSTVAALAKVDAKYPEYKALIKGKSRLETAKNQGIMTPDAYMGGIKAASDDVSFATGKAPAYGLANDLMQTAGKKDPQPIIDWLKGWSVNTPTLAPLETMGQTLLGKTAPQKAAQSVYNNPIAGALRNYGARGSIAGTIAADELQE